MVDYSVNGAAMQFARQLIDDGNVVLDSSWSDVRPTPAAENTFIERDGWAAYGRWHLGLRDGAHEQTKERFGFPFGDFVNLHRSGLIACVDRAGEWHHQAIEDAAHQLLALIDDPSGT
ncbi:MAG: hypothetical protein KDB86_14015 [Actinobacteria bacterium]|nr:hypothetical protein [Actinomycetota bacterium]MCB9388043.1 hypothetical protein [Acidimicrobiia bacterium]